MKKFLDIFFRLFRGLMIAYLVLGATICGFPLHMNPLVAMIPIFIMAAGIFCGVIAIMVVDDEEWERKHPRRR